MRLSFIFIFFLISTLGAFSQSADSLYSKGVKEYDAEAYKQSLENFRLAKQQFLTQKNISNVVNCLSYISKINSLQSNYLASLNNNIEALSYLKLGALNNDSIYAELMSGKILSLKFLGEFQNAYGVADSLISRLNKKRTSKKYLANAYQIKSRVEIDLGNYDNAINTAKKSLALNLDKNQERKAALINIIGVGFYFKEQLDSASYYYHESYKIKRDINADDYQLAIATCNIGIVQESLGNYDKAIEFYNKAVAHDLKDRGEDIGILSDIYVALANTYFKKNDLEKAEEFANKALQIALKKYGEDSPNTSFVYVSYSNIFELKGDFLKNIEYTQKALDIRRKTYGDYHRWTAESLLSIAESQIELGQFQDAKKNYDEVVDIAKSINNKLLEAYAEMGIGRIYTKTNQYALADEALNNAKANFINTYGKYHGTHLSALVLQAENYIGEAQPQKALVFIEEIKANAFNSNLFFYIDALTLQLDIALRDFIENSKTSLLEKSVNELDNAIVLLMKIRKDYPTNKSKIYVNNSMNDFLAKAIEGVYILYQKTKDFKYVDKAFELSELNRSSSLVSGIQDVRFKKMANVPESLLQKENKLNHKLASLKKEIYYEEAEQKPDTNYMDLLLSEQLICRTELDSLFKKIESEYPKYYHLKYSINGMSIKELQTTILEDDQTVVEYFLTASHVYVFVISKDESSFLKLPKAKEIQTALKTFRNRLDKREDVKQESKYLFNLLVKDLNLNTKRLIIISDKELSHLPFEALIKENDFLIKDYIISYSGSASLLKAQQNDLSSSKLTENWSGFAPEFKTDNTLVSNTTEIESVAKLMKGETYLGGQASVANFIRSTQNSSILHLATHAEIDPINPLYSSLLFAQDSVLTASDIYTLPIYAELAVLSACETGYGKLEKSEGVMSMARAFQYAGVSSTVMSLWKVPDQETTKLMESFYKYLQEGYSKDEALRNAKVDYLKTTDDVTLKHPFYWSGFIISGDVSALESNSRVWFMVLILAISLVLFFLRKQLLNFFK